jgi:hypothetical protein
VTSDPTNKNWVNPTTGLYELNPNYVAPAANGGLMQAYASGGTTSQDGSNKKDNKTTQGSYEFDAKTGKLKFIPASRGAGDVTGKTQAKTDAFFDNMTPEQQAEHQAQLAMIDQGLTPMAIKFLLQLKDSILYKPKDEPLAPVEDMSTMSPAAQALSDSIAAHEGLAAANTIGGLTAAHEALSKANVDSGLTTAAISGGGGNPGGIGIGANGVNGSAGTASSATSAAMGGLSPEFNRHMASGGLSDAYASGGVSGHLRSPHAFFQNGKYSFHSPQIYARGGLSNDQYNLGSYSDGGRLLRGPGDGVSDSIPATIGKGQPARLADGEFVVPARIVSEIGNGSTEAGARKLYAMMDRIQAARGKTVGKGKVAVNTKADKYLPK